MMKSLSLGILSFLTIAATGWFCLGQESAPKNGKALLLVGGRLMEGDIERIGEKYRIRSGTSEVWIGSDKAVRLCADAQDAYRYMKEQTNLDDPDERIRLARWCQLNSLWDQAIAEARAAATMRP